MCRRIAVTFGVALLFGALAATSLAASPAVVAQEVVRAPRGCPALSAPDMVAEQDRVATRVPEATAPTATDHASSGFDLPGVVGDLRSLSSRFAPVAEFVMPATGIAVTVLSDGPLEVDPEALERLALLSLEDPAIFTDTRVAEVQRCYAQRLLGDRELAGHELRVIVPSDPHLCFAGGRLTPVPATGFADACDSAGVTIPEVSIRPRVLGIGIGEARSPATVLVTAAAPPDHPDPEARLAALLLHELHHVTENAFGLTPWSGSLRHYEQRAYYVEREVRRHLRARDVSLPLPVGFVAPAG